MTINKWLNPDKIVESFMLYCYSKLSDEQIEDNLVEFREDMRSGLYKKLKRENPLPNTDSFHDEEVMKQREVEIKKEIDKNDSLLVDTMINKLRLGKDDWKKIIGISLSRIDEDKWDDDAKELRDLIAKVQKRIEREKKLGEDNE